MSKERAWTYADFRVGDVFMHCHFAFVLLRSDNDAWDVVGLDGIDPGVRKPGWLNKQSRVIAGYTVYRGGEVICTT